MAYNVWWLDNKQKHPISAFSIAEEDMGGAKRILEEQGYLEGVAAGLLKETGYLTACEAHETLMIEGDEESLQAAYKLANARVSSGAIKLEYGFSRRDLTDIIKDVAENTGDDCYSCQKVAQE
ncbi:MAG: hypothetical protein KGI37_10955 [Alphaproteobacteria bacterium]|nr:hypothetical protein [Alphaproteobacteria bacterium]